MVILNWVNSYVFILYVKKDLLRSVGKQRSFDCVLINYVMGLILFTLLTVLNILFS